MQTHLNKLDNAQTTNENLLELNIIFEEKMQKNKLDFFKFLAQRCEWNISLYFTMA